MSTILGRDTSALLVIDVQNGVAEGAFHRDEVITKIASAVESARAGGIPVVWHGDEQLHPAHHSRGTRARIRRHAHL